MKKIFSILASFAIMMMPGFSLSEDDEKVEAETDEPIWELISTETTATVYNAIASQCDASPLVTASKYQINPETVEKDRIVAMERTMMAEFGVSYGDSILVQGTGKYDGVWHVQDTMNKRYAGQHKIDFLVPNNIRKGKWEKVRVYRQI